jgi:hypothetical protein
MLLIKTKKREKKGLMKLLKKAKKSNIAVSDRVEKKGQRERETEQQLTKK